MTEAETIAALVETLRNARLLLKIKRDDDIALLQIAKIDAVLAEFSPAPVPVHKPEFPPIDP